MKGLGSTAYCVDGMREPCCEKYALSDALCSGQIPITYLVVTPNENLITWNPWTAEPRGTVSAGGPRPPPPGPVVTSLGASVYLGSKDVS